jgi:hypothetical protein
MRFVAVALVRSGRVRTIAFVGKHSPVRSPEWVTFTSTGSDKDEGT